MQRSKKGDLDDNVGTWYPKGRDGRSLTFCHRRRFLLLLLYGCGVSCLMFQILISAIPSLKFKPKLQMESGITALNIFAIQQPHKLRDKNK
eukprot:scaffold29814_cov48-Attheya_sp.AAC.4